MDFRNYKDKFYGNLSIFIITLLLLYQGQLVSSQTDQLNFLVVFTDDLGWKDLSCYGRREWETPNIDRLASEGMMFTNAYASCALCSPTRASMLTGKSPARLKITDFIPGFQQQDDICKNSTDSVNTLIYPETKQFLPLEEVTIAEALRQAGYNTAAIGKWHLGKKPYYPDKHGFDYQFLVSEHNVETYFGYDEEGNVIGNKDDSSTYYLNDLLIKKAEDWLDNYAQLPFFMYFSTYLVHWPPEAKEEKVQKYINKGFPRTGSESATYAAMIESMDESVGKLLDKLDELQIADHTVVVFVSDNGAPLVSSSNAPLRSGKLWFYEGGIRVPQIIKWPSVVTPGSWSNAPVITMDFYPTMLEMAGLPQTPEQHVDGVSLVPLLKQTGNLGREALFWHYPHFCSKWRIYPVSVILKDQWKLIEYYMDNRVELYNLDADVSEEKNLAEKMPEKVKQLQKSLWNWKKIVNARIPIQRDVSN
jgi:arylsulfatase A